MSRHAPGGTNEVEPPDLVVIGAGSAGLGAAREGVRSGARVVLVTDGEPGGECTHTGCVPSKTLLESAAAGLGFDAALARVSAVVSTVAATEDAAALRAEGIELLSGRARFVGPRELEVDGRRLRPSRVVVATGSRPRVPGIPGLDEVPFLTNENVFGLTARPASLAVLGGGAIGCELAQAFARLGVTVTVVEREPRLLPGEEPEASETIAAALADDGVRVLTGAEVCEVQDTRDVRETDGCGEGVRLSLSAGSEVHAARVLVTIGRTSVTDGLDVAAAGIALDGEGAIRTDAHLATTVEGVYAAGDVTTWPRLTHVAYATGRMAARNASVRRHRWQRFDQRAIPRVTYTDPEVASVGVTEASAPRGARVADLPMGDVDRALATGETGGFVRLIAGPRRMLRNLGGGELLGATVVAPRAGEMIAEPALVLARRMFTGRLAQTMHAYPTWAYAIQLAAAQFFIETGGRRARPAHRPS